jgi:hypothetical protein
MCGVEVLDVVDVLVVILQPSALVISTSGRSFMRGRQEHQLEVRARGQYSGAGDREDNRVFR